MISIPPTEIACEQELVIAQGEVESCKSKLLRK